MNKMEQLIVDRGFYKQTSKPSPEEAASWMKTNMEEEIDELILRNPWIQSTRDELTLNMANAALTKWDQHQVGYVE